MKAKDYTWAAAHSKNTPTLDAGSFVFEAADGRRAMTWVCRNITPSKRKRRYLEQEPNRSVGSFSGTTIS